MQPAKQKTNIVIDTGMELPPVVSKLNTMLADGRFAASDIGGILSDDAWLCGHMLRLANSPMYTDDMAVESIEQMINYVGVIQVRELLLLLVFMPRVRQLINKSSETKQHWRHHVYCGLLAYNLARQSRQVHPHTVYTSCLMRGITELLLSDAARNGQVDSKISAAQVIKQWGLPGILHECVTGFENNTGSAEFPEALAHVQIAHELALLPENVTVNRQLLGSVQDEYWQTVSIEDSRLDGCVKQAREMLTSVLALLTEQ
jgi:HD-like signal output (HDOD) protein